MRSRNKQWYVVHTKPRQERIAEQNLKRQEFEVYLPLIREVRRRRGRRLSVVEPLFPRYLFLRVDLEADNTAPVASTIGVSGMVRFGGWLPPVPNDFFDSLLRSAEADTGIHVPNGHRLQEGDPVTVVDGPFIGAEGIYRARSGEDRVIILLDCLGRQARVMLHQQMVAPSSA